jgi:hypothetical protein
MSVMTSCYSSCAKGRKRLADLCGSSESSKPPSK